MNSRIAVGALIGFVLAASAQEAAFEEKLRPIEQVIKTEMAKRKIPGLTIAIADRHRVIWEEGYGVADLENGTPVKESSRFRFASLSKPMTAVAVLQLVEKGKIKLDDDIREYVDAFSEKPFKVTVRQLLGHMGGVRSYRPGEIQSTRHYNDIIEPLEIFAKDPLMSQPGTRYLYSTYGFNLLGAAVQEAAGVNYADYIRQNIILPAGMKSTGPDDQSTVIPGRVHGYSRRSDGVVVNAALADTSNKLPGGGWLGTAGDVARFALAFRQLKLTKRETVDLMLRTQRSNEGRPTGYGMGWQLFQYGQRQGIAPEKRLVGHTGSQPGTNTYVGMTMDAAWSVAILTNLEGGEPRTIAEPIFEILLSKLDHAARGKLTGLPQQRLNLKVDPQGQSSLRPILGPSRR